MALHPPKQISSTEGLGVNTTKTMRRISDRVSIGTEVWNDMEEPWREGDTIIAMPGYVWTTKWELDKPYVITKFHDTAAHLVGMYCDVARPIQASGEGFIFTDLYLDVWQIPGKEAIILDEDELADAVNAAYITPDEAEEARRVARVIATSLNDPEFINF